MWSMKKHLSHAFVVHFIEMCIGSKTRTHSFRAPKPLFFCCFICHIWQKFNILSHFETNTISPQNVTTQMTLTFQTNIRFGKNQAIIYGREFKQYSAFNVNLVYSKHSSTEMCLLLALYLAIPYELNWLSS